MENFTPESLKNFLNRPPMPQSQHQPSPREKPSNSKPNLSAKNDAIIRQQMSELVRTYVQSGKLEELQSIMLEHRQFIDDILQLIKSKK